MPITLLPHLPIFPSHQKYHQHHHHLHHYTQHYCHLADCFLEVRDDSCSPDRFQKQEDKTQLDDGEVVRVLEELDIEEDAYEVEGEDDLNMWVGTSRN